MKRGAIVALLCLSVGCSHDAMARVESDTQWSGAFGNRTVEGNGNQDVDLPDETPTCASVQKQTRTGRLKVTTFDDGNAWLKWDGETAETIAEFGVVTVCINE